MTARLFYLYMIVLRQKLGYGTYGLLTYIFIVYFDCINAYFQPRYSYLLHITYFVVVFEKQAPINKIPNKFVEVNIMENEISGEKK